MLEVGYIRRCIRESSVIEDIANMHVYIGTYIYTIKNVEEINEVVRKTKLIKSQSQRILMLVDGGTVKVVNCLNHNVFGSEVL